MNKAKAIEKIMSDLHLPASCEDYVWQQVGMLGCDDEMDLETIKGVEIVLRREMSR